MRSVGRILFERDGVSGNWVLLGRVGRPHGLDGTVVVSAFTQSPRCLWSYPLWICYPQDSEGLESDDLGQTPDPWGDPVRVRLLPMSGCRGEGSGGSAIRVQLAGVVDREQARCCTGSILITERRWFANPQEPDDFYQTDLIGLCVRDRDDRVMGQVVGVHTFGGGDVLEILADRTIGRGGMVPTTTHLLSFTRLGFPCVALDRGTIWASDDVIRRLQEVP